MWYGDIVDGRADRQREPPCKVKRVAEDGGIFVYFTIASIRSRRAYRSLSDTIRKTDIK